MIKSCRTFIYYDPGRKSLDVIIKDSKTERIDFYVETTKDLEVVLKFLRDHYKFESAVVNRQEVRVAFKKIKADVKVFDICQYFTYNFNALDFIIIRRGENILKGVGTTKPITAMQWIYNRYVVGNDDGSKGKQLKYRIENSLDVLNHAVKVFDLNFAWICKYLEYIKRLNKLQKGLRIWKAKR